MKINQLNNLISLVTCATSEIHKGSHGVIEAAVRHIDQNPDLYGNIDPQVKLHIMNTLNSVRSKLIAND